MLEPYKTLDGLAIYRVGKGEPVLWMPYPHAASVVGDPVPDCLIQHLSALGRAVITFDPPHSGRSTRPMRLTFAEMIGCAEEALEACGVDGPVDVVGHSQGAFAALVLAIEQPQRVRSLVLVGGAASGPSYLHGPGALWNRSHPRFWKLALLGILYLLTRRLAAQNHLFNLIEQVSYVQPRPDTQIHVHGLDWLRPAFPRNRWADYARHQDYRPRLAEVRAPTLILVGQHDPQCPPACSEEMAQGIPDSRLRVFEQSGHYPFMEEPQPFALELKHFYESLGFPVC
ncbi:MAG: alpha/beta hydrolase [Meiothermus sp.]|nr:alpha/beta hydrolase [Meiothermus sp.]